MTLQLLEDYTRKEPKYGKWYARYRCECGKEFEAFRCNVNFGTTASCGCKRGRKAGYHGQWDTPTWRSWISMRTRCTQPSARRYAQYGGRGIKVCDRWNDFANFLADMGERPSLEHQVGRIDHDGNYEPGNVAWQTRAENTRDANRRRWSKAA
jgi:hypothetical protein